MQYLNNIPNFQGPQLFIINICFILIRIFFTLNTINIISFFVISLIHYINLKKTLFFTFIGINFISIIIYLILLITSMQLSFLIFYVPFCISNVFIYKLMKLDINQEGGN